MKWVLAFTTFALLVPATALGGKDELSGACEARLQEELGAVGESHSDN
jgi:hypothetical protein